MKVNVNFESLTLSYKDRTNCKQKPKQLTKDLLLEFTKRIPQNLIEEAKDNKDAKDKLKSLQPPILCFHNPKARNAKKTSWNYSNCVAFDLDTTIITDLVLDNVDLLFSKITNLVFIQKSFSGKIHMLLAIPECYNENDYQFISLCYYELIRDVIYDNLYPEEMSVSDSVKYPYLKLDLFSSNEKSLLIQNNEIDKLNQHSIDSHNLGIVQPFYISSNELYFNEDICIDTDILTEYISLVRNKSYDSLYNDYNLYRVNLKKHKSEIKCLDIEDILIKDNKVSVSLSLYIYYNRERVVANVNIEDNESDTENENAPEYVNPYDIEIPYVANRIDLNFNLDIIERNRIFNRMIRFYKTTNGGNILLRPAIYEENIYSVRLNPVMYNKKNENNEIEYLKIQQGDSRRIHIDQMIKIAYLNEVATANYKNRKIYVNNIIATVKWYVDNCIERIGYSRNITDDLIIERFIRVKELFDSIEIGYTLNSYYYKSEEKITTLEGWREKGLITRQKKYSRIGDNLIEFIKDNGLTDEKMSYEEIANIANENNIATKTSKYKWDAQKVYKEMKKHNMDYKSNNAEKFLIIEKVKDMKEAGYKYKEIAETLTVAFGKTFSENDVKNIVRRNLK